MSKLFRRDQWFAALAFAAVSGVASAQTASPTKLTLPPLGTDPAPAAAPVAPAAARPLPAVSAAQADLLRAMLDDRPEHGLTDAAKDKGAGPLEGEALVRAALDHARAVHAGRLDASDFQSDWGLRPAAFNPLPGFADAVARDRVAAWIADLPPPYAGYDGLRRGLANYRRIAADGGWAQVPSGPDLTMGSTGARVAALRKRLRVEDSTVAESGDYDRALLDAVRRAQRRYGLNPSGIMASQTLAALNVPVDQRIRQIMANMERWRWLPQELARDRIQVNIAAAVLTVFDGDAPVTSMKAVTGRPGDETPMLTSSIHSVVINPPWNVPTSIATKELWPKERSSPGYFRRNAIRVISLPEGGTRLQQAAGDLSALGRFKFDFDNRYSVYLHDTPSQAAFSRYSRLASHGCVRLEKPAELAELLLKGSEAWTPDAITGAVAKGTTIRAQLPKPYAVYLLYWTAYASANGQMNFRADPYDWDGILAAKIEARTQRAQLASR